VDVAAQPERNRWFRPRGRGPAVASLGAAVAALAVKQLSPAADSMEIALSCGLGELLYRQYLVYD